MKRLVIICEGHAEEMIVNRLLKPLLFVSGIDSVIPQLAKTGHSPRARRGGFTNWHAIEADLRDWFLQFPHADDRFTTLLDVFRMPPSAYRLTSLPGPPTTVAEVDALERAMEAALGEPRFRAYLQRQELEALFLADVDALQRTFPSHREALELLRQEISGYDACEDINHGPDTHPAARLNAAIPGYDNLKASNAYFVLAEANMAEVRRKCPRFNDWLVHWESWGAGT